MSVAVELVPFHDNFLADAAELLAGRYQRDRAVLPELPARFEDTAIAREAVQAAWRRPRTSGVAALSDGRLAGFLFGDVTIDAFRGRIAWIRQSGHAIDPALDIELYRDLYAAAGPDWLAYGCFKHYALVPAADHALLRAWYGLGFGQEQIYALRRLIDEDRNAVQVATPEGVTVRRATSEDGAALSEMATLIARHQAGPPVWVPVAPEDLPELREGYAELVDDPDATVWLALRDDQVVGFQAYFSTEPADDDPLTPEACIELKVAGTREEERGKGIGRMLTQRGLAEARAEGYAYCLTDWVATNLLSSRFWPRQGFRPMVYRMMRTIDDRVLWANGKE
jgi:GNAT superfamily N-acetyltransferase